MMVPSVGSKWRHKSGTVYTVLMLANDCTERPYEYPVTVVYQGGNGLIWCRPLYRWVGSMTALEEPVTITILKDRKPGGEYKYDPNSTSFSEAPTGESMFIEAWNETAKKVNDTAKEKGWWDNERNEGEIIALMHSELSEALEALRHGNPPDSHIPEFCGVEAELADVVIRIMDYAAAKKFRVAEAIEAKMLYNTKRAYKHGNKTF